jgi:predicted CxxxxCH...CXXCH cytochrome family protein
VTQTQLATFIGYTNGTGVKAATCSSVYCHGSRLKTGSTTGTYRKPYWNYSAMINYSDLSTACSRCHAFPPLDGTSGSSHTGKVLADCVTCHGSVVNSAGKIINKTLHINGHVDGGGHAMPYPGSVHRPGGTGNPVANATQPYTNCNGCHDATTDGGSYPATKPLCSACHTDQASFVGTSPGCKDCHGADATGRPKLNSALGNVFPNISGSHGIHVVDKGYTCSRCHFNGGTGSVNHGSSNGVKSTGITFVHVSSNTKEFHFTTTGKGTCSNVACHGAAEWGVTKFDCVSCHSITITRTVGLAAGKTLAAASNEFNQAWGHKKSGRGAVTAADCIVCHLEGVFATGKTSATYHKDGNIDLRDPDGSGEAAITNISGGAFTFRRFSTSYASLSRTSTGHTSNTDIANVITQKFCLKCHDSGGATNTSARSGSSPTATAPFGGGNTSLDAATQFATSNSSKHPILGPLTRDYPSATRMAVPYKPTGTRGTSGTKTAGVVINCFDCHTNSPALVNRTIVAHGNAVTLRGTYGGASPTFCTSCHLGYPSQGTDGHNSATGYTSGSAFTATTQRMGSQLDTCDYCHASSATAVRPNRAVDTHGSNTLPTGTKTGRWNLGTAQSVPIAFIRNINNLTNHQPKSVAGTSYSPQCDMISGEACGGRPGSPYSPGGTY